MFGNKIPTNIQNAFLPHFSSSASLLGSLHSRHLSSTHVGHIQSLWCSSKWHRGWGQNTVVSLLLLTLPLFLCWSSMGCRPCSTCIAMEKLPLTWPCYSLVLSSIPLFSTCPAFLPFLNHTFPEVPPFHLSGSAVPQGGSVRAGRNQQSENREEQNIVILFLDVMYKSVIFKIHLVSVSFGMRKS